jgi:hypothetical protein
VSLIISLYLFEFYLYQNSITKNNLTRIKLFEKNLENTSNVSLSGHTSQIRNFYALSNLPNSKTIGCNENGYISINYTDRYGFNNSDKVWEAGEINSILLGDSFVWGDCVNDENTIQGSMNAKNKDKINISLGQPGNGPLKNLATLKEFYPENKKVKKIFFFFYEGNDISDLKDEYQNPILKKYLTKNFSQNLKKPKTKNYIENSQREKLIKNFKLKKKANYEIYNILGFLKIQKTRHMLKRIELYKKQFDFKTKSKLEETFLQLKDFSEKNESELYIIYLPQYYRYAKFYFFYDYKKSIINMTKKFNINLIDVDKLLFSKSEDPLLYFPNRSYGHYTVEGYNEIAKILINY